MLSRGTLSVVALVDVPSESRATDMMRAGVAWCVAVRSPVSDREFTVSTELALASSQRVDEWATASMSEVEQLVVVVVKVNDDE